MRKEATKLLYKRLAEVLARTVSAGVKGKLKRQMFSRPATAENQALCTAENFANTVIQLPSNNLDTERHSLQL